LLLHAGRHPGLRLRPAWHPRRRPLPGHLPQADKDRARRAGGSRTTARPAGTRRDSGISFEDRLLGHSEGETDDFLVRRNDGAPAYQLAVVVDDTAQGIGEVVRGADLVDSTTRHILLYRLLGLRFPRYAHVPLVLGPDGRRPATRHGAVTLADRAAVGGGPRETLCWMARSLGLAEPGETPDAGGFLVRFGPGRLPRGPTVWSPEA
jgi:glutamyl-tRNA synthetase